MDNAEGVVEKGLPSILAPTIMLPMLIPTRVAQLAAVSFLLAAGCQVAPQTKPSKNAAPEAMLIAFAEALENNDSKALIKLMGNSTGDAKAWQQLAPLFCEFDTAERKLKQALIGKYGEDKFALINSQFSISILSEEARESAKAIQTQSIDSNRHQFALGWGVIPWHLKNGVWKFNFTEPCDVDPAKIKHGIAHMHFILASLDSYPTPEACTRVMTAINDAIYPERIRREQKDIVIPIPLEERD